MHCVSRGGCYLVNSHCELQEDNKLKKESYEAWWLSLVIETRPQYKLTLSETDSVRKESYKQQQVVHFMVQRSPCQTLRLGSHSGAMEEHHLPVFKSSREPHHAKATYEHTEERPADLEGVDNAVKKQEVTAISQDLRKPIRVNFRASSLMSSPREISQRVQRRE